VTTLPKPTEKTDAKQAAAVAAVFVAEREKQNVSGRGHAEAAGLPQSTLWKLEHGRMRWTLALLVRLGRALGLKPSTILDRAGL
jgi:transcriptional regulator with XRE-family HTH domain